MIKIKNKILIMIFLITNIYGNVKVGKELYLINCANCHSVNMSGSFGKDFNLVSYTRTKQEIKNYITNPSKEFRHFGYSANAMPTLPLNEKEVKDIANYIDSLQPFKKWMKD